MRLLQMVVCMRSGKYTGFILIGMLLLMMLGSMATSHSLVKWRTQQLREREQELIRVGMAYRDAIDRYYNQTPSVVKTYPPNLQALLLDTRFPVPRRHLRRQYLDPMTQRSDWGIVEAPTGGVMGIYSLSGKSPFKTKGYLGDLQHLNDKKSYADWYFIYTPGIVPAQQYDGFS